MKSEVFRFVGFCFFFFLLLTFANQTLSRPACYCFQVNKISFMALKVMSYLYSMMNLCQLLSQPNLEDFT